MAVPAIVDTGLDLVVVVGGMTAELAADTGVVGVRGAVELVADMPETPVIPDIPIHGIITGTPWDMLDVPPFELPSTMVGIGKKGN